MGAHIKINLFFIMSEIPKVDQNIEVEEQSPEKTFSKLSPKIMEFVQKLLDGVIDVNNFLISIEGIPGRDAFYKRLRTGTKVRVLRSSGEMDLSGWVIDSDLSNKVLEDEILVQVHHKEKHLSKLVPLADLIRWNI